MSMDNQARNEVPRSKLLALAAASVDGFRSLSLAADGGLQDDVGGARCWYSSSYMPVFNGAGLFSESLLNRGTLSAIDRYFRARGRPYCVAILDGLVPPAVEALRSYGYSEYDSLPAMWLDGPPAMWGTEPEGLEIAQVSTPQELAIYRDLLGRVFHLPANEVDLVMGNRSLQISHVRHYLVRLGPRPVATLTMVLGDEVAGIWNVGTLREWRRRGISAATMRYALAEARNLGYRSSMLLASEDGLPMYIRLGYRTLSTLRILVPYGQ